ncbi:protein spinster homolog 2 [Callorhinchus milii]|uniref:protein spinster homolog 2 n=1 Tax=Callorhinchus milii TaxID=7868 RepID=UPI001C3FD4DB|nr:protein spinster homolog 2 [Callorhinchus milii]
MDRYTVAGVLADIQRHFEVSDSKSGLLPTVFIFSFMVATPIFGFLGDRFNRKFILSCGIFFWSAVTITSSFITKPNFWLLLFTRALVGFGEASYSTIAPTMIADMFTKDTRTCMLCFFYLAIPLGSGLGYILGSSVTQAAGDWHWALRVTPAMGLTAGTLIILLVPEPKRGAADQHTVKLRAGTSWSRDMKAVIKIPSFVFLSLASASVAFATGVLGMWIPLYLFRAEVVQKHIEPCTREPCSGRDSLIFGIITCITGFLGLILGVAATRWYRTKTARSDPLVCAFGMLSSSIFISLIFVFARFSILGAYICIFIGETLLFLNWAITADILMYVVIPTRRSTAVALQSFTSHLLGDAGSPYLIGVISDVIQHSKPDLYLWEFLSLGYALMLCPFIIVLGGTFFLATAHYIVCDRERAQQLVEEMKLVAIKV